MLSYAKLLVDDAFYLISGLNSHVSFLCDHPRVASKDLPSLFHVFRGGYHLGSDSRTKFWIAWIVENTAPRWLAILGSSWSSILQRWPHRSATKRVLSLLACDYERLCQEQMVWVCEKQAERFFHGPSLWLELRFPSSPQALVSILMRCYRSSCIPNTL
jgi:hypothetical protein